MSELDEISNIEKIIDPTKIELLDIGEITTDHEFLSHFTNLRDLRIWNYCDQIDL